MYLQDSREQTYRAWKSTLWMSHDFPVGGIEAHH
jgi:hypothetical protein